MTDTYALRIQLESHEYDGEFYLVGEGHGTPAEVLEHVAAEHILGIENAHRVERYLLDVLATGEPVSEAEFEQADADVRCAVHADTAYRRYAFWAGEEMVTFDRGPTSDEIASTAADL
jgi:hypothetical protein